MCSVIHLLVKVRSLQQKGKVPSIKPWNNHHTAHTHTHNNKLISSPVLKFPIKALLAAKFSTKAKSPQKFILCDGNDEGKPTYARFVCNVNKIGQNENVSLNN